MNVSFSFVVVFRHESLDTGHATSEHIKCHLVTRHYECGDAMGLHDLLHNAYNVRSLCQVVINIPRLGQIMIRPEIT